MENIFVEFLPPWVETGLQPAFYDKESGTVIQQTARMYARVNMLIRMFNKLSKKTKETVEEYINKFTELHDYVQDYFDNLDVQEEINNKIDAMVEAGTLQEIVADYLNSKAVFGFDSVADMKVATNLIDGSYAETYGFHSKSDNGGAKYKIRNITNDDIVDERTIIEITGDPQNNLVAELVITKNMSVEQFGAYGDDNNDDIVAFTTMMNKVGYIATQNKIYKTSLPIELANGINVDIKGTLKYTGADFAIKMSNNTRNDIYIKNLLAPNGNGILMDPQDTSSMVWFNKINVINANCSGNVLKMVGNKRFVSNNVFTGSTWTSTSSTTIYIYVPTGSESESWVTENIFNGINLIADKTTRRSITILNENNKDIEIRLNNIDFEDGFGISCTGYVGHISMIDCRLDEIYNKNGWLSFTGRVPSHMEIIGDSNLHPSRFTFTDLASGDVNKKFLYTNCTMYDFETDSTINGGWVSSTTIYPDQFNNSTQKDLTNLTEYTFAPSLSGGLWTGFKTYATSALTVTIPTTLFNAIRQRFITAYFISNNTVTINIGTETKTLTVNAFEWYQIYYVSGQIKLVKYS